MAKLSQIDRWISDIHNTDTCAVCGCSLGFRSSSSFCSAKCNDLAERVRGNLRNQLIPYTDLDFRLSFLEGVYPTLLLPEVLQQYYPGKAQRIYPIMPQEIQTPGQIPPMLRPGIIRDLGDAVVREVEFAHKLWGTNFIQKRECFKRGLVKRMFLQSGTIICPDCGHKWFDGELTCNFGSDRCCEPVQIRMPF